MSFLISDNIVKPPYPESKIPIGPGFWEELSVTLFKVKTVLYFTPNFNFTNGFASIAFGDTNTIPVSSKS